MLQIGRQSVSQMRPSYIMKDVTDNAQTDRQTRLHMREKYLYLLLDVVGVENLLRLWPTNVWVLRRQCAFGAHCRDAAMVGDDLARLRELRLDPLLSRLLLESCGRLDA